MPNKQNIELMSTIADEVKAASAIWVVDYRGLTVKETEELRHAIRETGSTMAVRKNTLMRIALKDAGEPEIDDVLEGPSAFVFAGDDPVAAAKAIKTFADAHKTLEIKGGIMDGAAYNTDEVLAIAELPTREQMMGQIAGMISGVARGLAVAINEIPSGLARAINAVAQENNAA